MFNYWYPISYEYEYGIKSFNLNFGPQHPAAHGVLRIILQLRGEIIERGDTHIGLLHRGSEKLLEERPYALGLPYFDRLDYTAILMQEHAYCLAIEDLLGCANYTSLFVDVRVLFDELTRVLNHLIALSTHSMDVGTMAIFFWAFEERERIMEFYERVSGARMHAAFYRPSELAVCNISLGLVKDIVVFTRDLLKRVAQIEGHLSSTVLWRARLAYVGVISSEVALQWGVTGPLSRSAGLRRDLRLNYTEAYGSYYYLNIRSFIGEIGDCYDRFLIRMRETVESVHIITQIINKWSTIYNFDMLDTLYSRHFRLFYGSYGNRWSEGMEGLINHFKYFSDGGHIPVGISYRGIESAKGEFGVFIVADGSLKPYRCRIRSPAYYHTQLFSPMIQGHYFADLITIIGSQDIVMGEVDRLYAYRVKFKKPA